MRATIAFTALIFIAAFESTAQDRSATSIAALKHIAPWPKIGLPPARDSAPDRASAWQRESRPFTDALNVLREDWSAAEAPANLAALRARVRAYEGLIRTVTNAGGYGNLLLADILRRLSLTVTTRYLFRYLNDYPAVQDLLKEDRVRFLECPALLGLLDETKVAAPSGGWHLSTKREDYDVLFPALTGQAYNRAWDRAVFGAIGQLNVSHMMAQPDVAGLILRLINQEQAERFVLAGFLEFLKRGGRLEDIRVDDARPFGRVMGAEACKFSFMPMGLTCLGAEYLNALVRSFKLEDGKVAGFSAVIAE